MALGVETEKEASGPSEAYDSVEKLSEVVGEEIIIEVIDVPDPSSEIEEDVSKSNDKQKEKNISDGENYPSTNYEGQDETTQSNNVVVQEYIETSNSKSKGHEEENGSSEETMRLKRKTIKDDQTTF
nr:unnamed protein product [Callosobruchus analis]